MLRAIRERHGDGLPFLGINFGTKGFLLNRAEDLQNGGEFSVIRYPLLDVTTETSEGKKSGIAFNEAQIKTAGGHMVTLDVSIGGHSEIRLRGDGLLVVTPAGSTGYNASAGGPILPHSSKLLLATPLLSFEPKRAAPAVFEENETVRVIHSAERGQTLSVFADSQGVLESYGKRVEITVQKRLEAVRLLIPKKTIQAWKRKIFEEQGFKPANSHH
jgi:NAD+ kinase